MRVGELSPTSAYRDPESSSGPCVRAVDASRRATHGTSFSSSIRHAQPKWSLLHGRRSVCPAGRRSRLTRRAHGIRSSMCAPPPHTTRGSFDASRRAANGTSFSSSIRHAQPKWSLLHGRRSVCPAVRRHHDTTTAPSLFSRVRPPAASLPRQLEGSLFLRLGMPSVSRGRANTFD